MTLNRYEKLILLLVALVILARFGGLARDVLMAQMYGAGSPGPDMVSMEKWKFATFLITSLINIGSAIWIYIEARSAKLSAWVWALLGLFFGLVGLMLFYLIQIYKKLSN